MLVTSREARDLVEGKTLESYLEDRTLQLALRLLIQIVGEAASRVSQARRDAIRDVPWREIIGMRHRLVHGYAGIDTTIIWEVATEHIPALIAALEAVVQADSEEAEDQ
ncbi:MAG TPA: HepT-like ribonuclease domain-containing protein [Dehalococcoidia bacterium]|nr:HepT-like ribonuclease domain-containing protein [Dehalococcoidia bacterium]